MIKYLTKNTDILCNCTLGYQHAMWSEFLGQKINSELVDSILRGGKECIFKVTL